PAAGDHARTLGGGAQQHAPGAEDAGHLVGDRGAVLGHPEEVATRALDALLDRQRDLVRLAVADADLGLLVADHHERGEREAPAALDHLGDAVDLDDPLLEVALLTLARFAGHRSIEVSEEPWSPWTASEAQSRLAGGVGKRPDPAVEQVSAAVEHASLGAGGGWGPRTRCPRGPPP